MKRYMSYPARILLAAMLVAMLLPSVATSAPTPQRYIVTFTSAAAEASALGTVAKLGGITGDDLPGVRGAVVYLPSKADEKTVHGLKGVKTIEPDVVVEAVGKTPAAPRQMLPWGVDKIDAEKVWPTGDTGSAIKVGIIDTGIDTSHTDLAANIAGGVSEVSYTTSYSDDNGHGTHVAGTVAAVNNTFGVVGAAPSASLYAIKVLDNSGSGFLSDVVNGINWAVANHMNVVNMSLGTSEYSPTLDTAVQQAISAGVVVVAAAGNSGPGANTVIYPAKLPGVIAVGATDSRNRIASFSSRGPEVDVVAPGVNVYSTYFDNRYATISGTSMATPHVSGVVALVLDSPIGSDDANADGIWQPSEVTARIERTALDLGTAGFDTTFGYGLVRANLAVQP